MLSYESGAVVPANLFNFHALKEDGKSDGEWLKDSNGTKVYAKYFQRVASNSDERSAKFFAFVEFITTPLYTKLLGKDRTPKVLFLTSTAHIAIASVELANFQTISSFKKLEVLPSVIGDVGFEEYVATSVYLGNFDWANAGNFGFKDGKIAAIDFAFTFTLKFSTPSSFLTYLGNRVLCYQHHNSNDKTIIALQKLEFSLHRFIAALERILATPNAELLARMPNDIESFKNGCTVKETDSNVVKSAFVWDVSDEHSIPLDPTRNELTQPNFTPKIREAKDFTEFTDAYLTEQSKFFTEVLAQLKLIAKFDKPAEYFNIEWLWPYSKIVDGKFRVFEPLAYAAFRHIQIKDEDGETLDALDYALKHNIRVFGSNDPVHALTSFCHAWGSKSGYFKFLGAIFMPLNDNPKNYLFLDKYERYALMCKTSLCTTVKFEPFAQIIILKLNEIRVACHHEVEKNKGNAEKQNAAYANENRAATNIGEWLKEYRNSYRIDVYLLLFIAHSKWTFEHRNHANEINSFICTVARVFIDTGNQSNLIPSLFIDSRFLEGLKQHSRNIESEPVNYEYACRLLQFVGLKYISNLIYDRLKECISLINNTQSSVQLLSLIATFMFDKYEYTSDMSRMRREVDFLKTRPMMVFPEDFQGNIDRVFRGEKCIIPLIERF